MPVLCLGPGSPLLSLAPLQAHRRQTGGPDLERTVLDNRQEGTETHLTTLELAATEEAAAMVATAAEVHPFRRVPLLVSPLVPL